MKKERLDAPETSTSMESKEIYELFLEELQARRHRLRQLLQMVTLEAERGERQESPAPARARCRRPARQLA
jgi:hypothetical protein